MFIMIVTINCSFMTQNHFYMLS